ncbi:hypothetical protein DICSQDRAFT_127542 [Dichomitus squalens LYAD-421 SS1]|uniref:Uncharacterized protein n=1 Tax=Dichomitus squalens (strain LYAD-421) TaxID=732165 RepID=R7T0L9_DICSQ|nr:uncharacterized protein DICSQDRAFT_127542 [Dichomitus squalens LYAD-421 SS1]EJF60707.1 hypothetical protein DICSQDRAFT_127542 [Dichomitus squalens LYAD-421 SS1]
MIYTRTEWWRTSCAKLTSEGEAELHFLWQEYLTASGVRTPASTKSGIVRSPINTAPISPTVGSREHSHASKESKWPSPTSRSPSGILDFGSVVAASQLSHIAGQPGHSRTLAPDSPEFNVTFSLMACPLFPSVFHTPPTAAGRTPPPESAMGSNPQPAETLLKIDTNVAQLAATSESTSSVRPAILAARSSSTEPGKIIFGTITDFEDEPLSGAISQIPYGGVPILQQSTVVSTVETQSGSSRSLANEFPPSVPISPLAQVAANNSRGNATQISATNSPVSPAAPRRWGGATTSSASAGNSQNPSKVE